MNLFIEAYNFLGFGDEGFAIDFSELGGLVFIRGENRDAEFAASNGAGKSSIPDAILWGLYGITSRGLKFDEVVNTTRGKDCFVKIKIQIGNEMYEIIRTRKHEKLGNSLCFNRVTNGSNESLTGNSMGVTQDKINELIGLDEETVIATNIFGQDTKSFVDYTDGKQKNILTKLLQYDILDEMYDEADDRLKRADNTLDMVVRRSQDAAKGLQELRTLDYTIKSEEFESGRLRDLEDFQMRLSGLAAEKENQIEELAHNLFARSNKFDKERGNLEETIKENTRRKEEKSKELDGLKDTADLLKERQEVFQEVLKELNIQDGELKRLQKKLDNMRELGVGTCSLCYQEITEATLDKHISETVEEKEELIVTLREINKLYKEAKEEKTESEGAVSRTNRLNFDIEALSSLIKDHAARVLKIDIELGLIDEEAERESEKLVTHFAQLSETINRDMKATKETVNPYRELAEENKKKIIILQDKIKHFDNQAQSNRERIEVLHDWKVAFGKQGIRSQLFDRIVNLLDSKVHYYMSLLSEGAIHVSFDTETELKGGDIRDKFDIIIADEEGSRLYKSYSGGEKRRIKLAIDLGLSDIVCEERERALDFVIFDEVLTGMDSVGEARTMDMWRAQLDDNKKRLILVIDHSVLLRDMFDKEIAVVLEDGIRKVVI